MKQGDDADGTGAEGVERQPDGTAAPVSPGVVIGLGAVAALFSLAAGASYVAGSHSSADGWTRADTVLRYVTTAVFSAAVLAGLGTLVLAISKGLSAGVRRTARILMMGGVAVVVLGIADVVCISGGHLPYGREQDGVSWYVTGHILSTMASTVFSAGVIEGLAYLCLRAPGHLRCGQGSPAGLMAGPARKPEARTRPLGEMAPFRPADDEKGDSTSSVESPM